MQKLSLLTILLASTIWCKAQDIILLTTGDTLHCKIIEAGAYDLTYKLNGQTQTIKSKKYISYAKDYRQAPPTTQQASTAVKAQVVAQLDKKEPTAGDHLINSGKLTIASVAIAALAIIGGSAILASNTDQNIGVGVIACGATLASALQFASVTQKIKAGKKLNEIDTTLPKK